MRLAMATLTTLALAWAAADGPPAKPSGTWKRETDDAKITFAFKPDQLQITLDRGGNTIYVEADYGVTKNGTLYGCITKVKKDGDGGPEEGDPFSFRLEKDGDALVISDLKPGTNENAKQIVEGKYQKVQ